MAPRPADHGVGPADRPDPARRDVLRGVFAPRRERLLRPPWTGKDPGLRDCTACGDCIRACPEGILRADRTGRPHVVFMDGGACSLCGACARACQAQVFGAVTLPPWETKASIGDNCLAGQGVSCQVCTDACDSGALAFDARTGIAGKVRIQTDNCTGCGACLSVCPVAAISLVLPSGETVRT